MDFQNRAGGKTGSGGQASWSDMNRDRRERLRQLALETIDLAKDPYFMKNHLGSYECKLCLTLHNNEGSYLAHTQVINLERKLTTKILTKMIRVKNIKPIWQDVRLRKQKNREGLKLPQLDRMYHSRNLSKLVDLVTK